MTDVTGDLQDPKIRMDNLEQVCKAKGVVPFEGNPKECEFKPRISRCGRVLKPRDGEMIYALVGGIAQHVSPDGSSAARNAIKNGMAFVCAAAFNQWLLKMQAKQKLRVKKYPENHIQEFILGTRSIDDIFDDLTVQEKKALCSNLGHWDNEKQEWVSDE